MKSQADLFYPITLPCGVTLKNRIAKSAMSDSLGDGTGHPTVAQNRLYRRWADGGAALSIIGEVQSSPGYAEKPGNLVLNEASDIGRFESSRAPVLRMAASYGCNWPCRCAGLCAD